MVHRGENIRLVDVEGNRLAIFVWFNTHSLREKLSTGETVNFNSVKAEKKTRALATVRFSDRGQAGAVVAPSTPNTNAYVTRRLGLLNVSESYDHVEILAFLISYRVWQVPPIHNF